MQIHEIKRTDNGKNYMLIEFCVHKAVIYTREITLDYERCASLRTARAKEEVIESFLTSSYGRNYTEKEVIKAYSKIDKYFKDVYKNKYPHGGYHGGGRPKGSKTDKTERLNLAVTAAEKEFLIKALDNFRKSANEVKKQ